MENRVNEKWEVIFLGEASFCVFFSTLGMVVTENELEKLLRKVDRDECFLSVENGATRT